MKNHTNNSWFKNFGFPTTSKRNRLRSRTGLQFERLESRQLLTGDFVWAARMGSTASDYGNSIETDATGNVYTVGSFSGTVDFDSGSGISNLTSAGEPDIFLTKFNSGGALVWAKSFGSTSFDRGIDLAIDSIGQPVVTGIFSGTVDFNPGAGISNLTASDVDIFILKLTVNGDFVWCRKLGGPGQQSPSSIAIDDSGNIITTGAFISTVDFDPGSGIHNLTSTSPEFSDAFVSKLDANGNFIWAKQTAGILSNGVATDISGNVYTTGYFYHTVDFDPGVATYNLASESFNIFVSKLDAAGNFVWAKGTQGGDFQVGQGLEIDGSGNVLVTGRFRGTVDFNPGPGTQFLTSAGSDDAFVWKVNSSGNFVWAQKMGGSGQDYGVDIEVDQWGNVYSVGPFQGTADFNPGPTVSEMTSSGGTWDVFISKLDSNGNYVWARRLGGAGSEYPSGISLDSTNNILITGGFEATADVDPRGGIYNLTALGSDDIFVSKLTQELLFSTGLFANNRVVLRKNGADVQLVNETTGTVLVTKPLSQIYGAQFTGVNKVHDKLTIDYRSGGYFYLPQGIRFDGGSIGNDVLSVIGNSAENAGYLPSENATRKDTISVYSTVDFTSTTISFSNVEASTVSHMERLEMVTRGSRDILTASAELSALGAMGTRISGTSGDRAIVPITFDNVRNVAIDIGIFDAAGSDDDSFVFNENSLEAVGWRNFDLYAGIGNDLLIVNNADLRLPSTGGNFWFHSESGLDQLRVAGDTNFQINDSQVTSDAGGRILFDSLGSAMLSGGAGDNELSAIGFSGRTFQYGYGGNDILRGSNQIDRLFGGEGNDQLYGGLGNDLLNGEAGADTLYFDGTTSADDLRLQYGSATSATFRRRALGATTDDEIDAITYDASDSVRIYSLAGNDLINVDAAFAILGTVNGGPGSDTCTAPRPWTKISC